MRAWTQLSWTNEQKVLARTLVTLLNESSAFYLQCHSQDDGGDFQTSWKELERRREVDLRATRKSLQGFKNDLKAIRSKQLPGAAAAAAGGDASALGAIKDMLESFEGKLSGFKAAMRRDYDALQADFVRGEEEVQRCLESSSALQQPSDSSSGDRPQQQQQQQQQQREARRAQQEQLDNNLQMQHRVALLDKQIQEGGGRYGRWDPRDHDVFLRIWNQTPAGSGHHPKKAALCRKLAALVVDKTDVDCAEHYDWYIRHTRLLEEKKILLGEWKGVALSEKTRAIHAVLSERRGAGSAEAASEDRDADTSRGVESRAGVRRHSESETQSMREQIERWRGKKAEEKEEKLLASRDDEARERARQEDLKRRRQQEARLQLEKWHADEAVAKTLAAAQPPRSPGKKQPLAVEANHSRDMDLALRRRQEREAKEKAAGAREQRMRQAEAKLAPANVQRDTQRLQAATVAFGLSRRTPEQLDDAERRRASAGAHSGPMALNARDLSSMRRATPAWIQRP